MTQNKATIHIAFLGPKGSYSHIAAMKYAHYYFGKFIECSCQNFQDIFFLVETQKAEYGILPIENSNSGFIEEVCNLLSKTHLMLIGNITIPIQHHILVKNNQISLNKIKIIYSHPQPVQQCSKFLKKNSNLKILLCASSAVAIKKVAFLNQPNIAALGSIQGGEYYGLQPLLLPQIISNHPYNSTRFVIVKNTNF
ncbi:prephenate dehydratase [Candidatus Blochmanniella vafra str. BVAF]|uniref:prephenate dehydratase n=1 Tax=Blochmanniella vafra (strain BVAF) TaxID=859654 RepID=E8Q5T8_BLOVB|nr:prephenate dehydratase domain-containing protein [Candidatus Blochmannia vafer]ADV33585.1 prephenate dehydratase [Candidatus Blochmannia vafer str. BVAF]